MAQEWAKQFYKSRSWQECRRAYVLKVHGLCERCYAKGKYVPGYVVHHKITLTPSNINNPSISLNGDNLYYVCVDCHAKEHSTGEAVRDDVMFDEDGNLIKR